MLAVTLLLAGASWSLAGASEPSTIAVLTLPLPAEQSHKLCARHGGSPQCVSTGKLKAAHLTLQVSYSGVAPAVTVSDCATDAGVGVEVTTLPGGASIGAKIIAPGTLTGAEHARLDVTPVSDRGVCFLVTGG